MKILGRESGWTFEAEGSKAESEPIFLLYSNTQRWNGSVKSVSEVEQEIAHYIRRGNKGMPPRRQTLQTDIAK